MAMVAVALVLYGVIKVFFWTFTSNGKLSITRCIFVLLFTSCLHLFESDWLEGVNLFSTIAAQTVV